MELKLVKEVLKIDVYGREVLLNFPNRLQSKKLRARLQEKDINHDEMIETFLVELGMPIECIDEISDSNLVAILKALQPVEKKS